MTRRETFETRMKRARDAANPPELTYDQFSPTLRNQIVFVLRDALKPNELHWDEIRDELRREFGILGTISMVDHQWNRKATAHEDLEAAVTTGRSSERILSVVEAALMQLTKARSLAEKFENYGLLGKAIETLNARFRDANVGYAVQNTGLIVRLDSEYVQTQMIDPALRLLQNAGFAGAEAEFQEAHAKYRNGDYRSAVQNAGNAFESVMKAILIERKVTLTGKETAKPLLDLLQKEGLFKPVQADGFNQSTELMVVLSRIRNQPGHSHGAGAAPVEVRGAVAAHALHLLAANILLLIALHRGEA